MASGESEVAEKPAKKPRKPRAKTKYDEYKKANWNPKEGLKENNARINAAWKLHKEKLAAESKSE